MIKSWLPRPLRAFTFLRLTSQLHGQRHSNVQNVDFSSTILMVKYYPR